MKSSGDKETNDFCRTRSDIQLKIYNIAGYCDINCIKYSIKPLSI